MIVYLVSFAGGSYKGGVKVGIMRNKGCVSAKFKKALDRFPFARSVCHHFIGYSRKLGNIFGDMLFGIYKGVKFIHNLHIFKPYGADFRNALGGMGKTCGFNVKNYYFVIYRTVCTALYKRMSVIDKISLHSVKDLKFSVGIILANAVQCVHSVRKRLNIAVVGDCHSPMSPFKRPLYQISRRGDCVQIRHIAVHMKLHTLFGSVVGFRRNFDLHY